MSAAGLTVSKIQAVVFDLDGLMLNTEDVFCEAGKQLLSRRGLEMTDTIHRSMLGRRPDEAFQAMKDLTGISDSVEDLKQETRVLFEAIAENHLATMPGLLPLLHRIDSIPLPRAVATSSPRDYMENLLGRFDLRDGFDVTLTAEDVTMGKPDPEIYLTAAKRLNVPVSAMVVLEDSEAGTRAAAAAGAIAVCVPNQHTCEGDFTMASLRVETLAAVELHRLIAGETL